jgi:hypothetical protein
VEEEVEGVGQVERDEEEGAAPQQARGEGARLQGVQRWTSSP